MTDSIKGCYAMLRPLRLYSLGGTRAAAGELLTLGTLTISRMAVVT